ncbi:ESV128-type glutaredoxin [Saudi moumouvirus]|uniref:Putative glutaredoxin n=1 Tax=Moumouvirus sp. 'Monve' TaxID=1128131 RepID=H2EG04_9VIRU|nr:putative glutaredoxin [Moumouvirus Monve]AQN68110.1 ESV128-type glutaredoxin [Saudi moumouvirus]
MQSIPPIISKIVDADPNTFIIFFVPECPYCQRALGMLRNSGLAYKGYDINTINGNMPRLLDVLNQYAYLTNFNPTHATKPVIFINGQFLGGSDDLATYLANQFGY